MLATILRLPNFIPKKYTAVTFFMDARTQRKTQDQGGEMILIDEQHTSHFEIGQPLQNTEKTVTEICEVAGGVDVHFSDGIVWGYKGFKYIIS